MITPRCRIMRYRIPVFCLLFLFPCMSSLYSQVALYEQVYDELSRMLNEEKNMSLKDAVFLTENAYMDGSLSRTQYEAHIQELTLLAHGIQSSRTLAYKYQDKQEVEKYAALYHLMTDTTTLLGKDGSFVIHLPFTYDFDDVFAEGDWQQMFVTKLLRTKKGNCHSLPYLYKIIADEIGAEAHIALAPNHIYIKHQCEKTGWYNTELTSSSFPIDAWIMASGYVYLEAIQNGIYMKAFNETETIAMCVIDLAMGYDRKFPDNDGSFILKCCSLALKHFPNYITAILLKAETLQHCIQQLAEQHHVQSLKDLFPIANNAESLWKDMEATYLYAHRIGYRQMPKQMYFEWLGSLHTEREKYSNRKVVRFSEE